jgi:ApbE superfamily uncharacterized protein (UPF0280 family)
MPSVYDIYERKNYRNRIPLAQAVSFEVEVRETHLHIQAHSDLGAKAKDAVFRYRYQIEEYLRQHPALRETSAPIQIYASAPEIVRYTDIASRNTSVPPMHCMSGAIADFVGRDLAQDTANIVVASGGDAFIKSSYPLEISLWAQGSPLHERLVVRLPAFKKCFGISTYVPNKKIHAVTVISRSACWASSFAADIGLRLARGEGLSSVLDRAKDYKDVGGIILVSGATIVVGGDMVLKAVNGSAPAAVHRTGT